jgi:hypothetical protein
MLEWPFPSLYGRGQAKEFLLRETLITGEDLRSRVRLRLRKS